MKLKPREYARRVQRASPPSPLGKDCLWAFFVGGGICLLGEVLRQWYLAKGLELELAGTLTSCTLVASVGAIQECVADCIAQATGTEVEKPETTEVTGRVPGYCGPGDWLGEAPADPDKYEDAGTYDVVIVGGGHAGVGAAFGAVDEGATVAVIEKQPWGNFVDLDGTGTNMGGWYGEDIGHVNSKLLIERGYGPYDTGAITSEFCKRAAGRVNPEIIKNFVQYSGQMFDRYEEIYDSYEEERKANDSDVYLADTAVIVPKATGDGKTGDQWVDGEPAGGAGHYDLSDMFQYPLCNTQAAYGQHKASYPISCGGYLTWPCNAQFYGYQGNNIEYIHKYIVKYVQETPNCAWDFEREGIKLIQDESGKVTEVYAEYDPDSRGGDPADGRKVKGATIHWVDAETCVDAEVRLYDNLFLDAQPDGADKDFLECMNPESLTVLTGCKVESALVAEAKKYDEEGDGRAAHTAPCYQFMRVGYFCLDSKDCKADHLVFNRSVLLKDSFKK